jgi:hypothetical protein
MAADVMSTKVVNETLNEFTEDSLLAWERAKQGGLNKALAFTQNSQGAKMIDLDSIEFLSQQAYEKLLKSDFKSLDELNDFNDNVNRNHVSQWYTCFYYTKKENNRKKFLIDSIFMR